MNNSLNQIESTLQQAPLGDCKTVHEQLVYLIEVIRDQQAQINRLLEAVPSAGYSESMQEYKHRYGDRK